MSFAGKLQPLLSPPHYHPLTLMLVFQIWVMMRLKGDVNYNLSVAWLMKKEQTSFPSGLCFYLFSLLYLKEA